MVCRIPTLALLALLTVVSFAVAQDEAGAKPVNPNPPVSGQAVAGTSETSQDQTATTTLSLGTSIVLVPTTVRTKSGKPVFTLTADNFIVTDDGIVQKARLEEDAGAQPLALVVVLEAGDTPETKFGDYAGLGTMLAGVVGDAEHRIAVVGFDSEPAVVQPFTSSLDQAQQSLANLQTGDGGSATLDALAMATKLLRGQPLRFRRAILLVSETVDRGSHISPQSALRDVSDTNTVIYSLGYSSTRATTRHQVGAAFGSDEAGPPHGCMGKYPDTDLEGNPLAARQNTKAQGASNNKAAQAYDCLSLLAPPLRLAKAAVLAALNGLRTNVPETAAHLTGGEYFKTESAKRLTLDMAKIANRLPNRYFLSFTPNDTHPGLHAINVTLVPPREGVVVEARSSYWQRTPPQP